MFENEEVHLSLIFPKIFICSNFMLIVLSIQMLIKEDVNGYYRMIVEGANALPFKKATYSSTLCSFHWTATGDTGDGIHV